MKTESCDYIELTGMEFFSFHGHYQEEQIVGNRYIVDLRVSTDFTKAGLSDDLSDTIDYQELYKIVAKVMSTPSKLLESVAKKILDDIRDRYPDVSGATVSIAKLNPALGGQVSAAKLVMSF